MLARGLLATLAECDSGIGISFCQGASVRFPPSSYLKPPVGKQAARLIFCPPLFCLDSARSKALSDVTRRIPACVCACASVECKLARRKLSVIADKLLIQLSKSGLPDSEDGTHVDGVWTERHCVFMSPRRPVRSPPYVRCSFRCGLARCK